MQTELSTPCVYVPRTEGFRPLIYGLVDPAEPTALLDASVKISRVPSVEERARLSEIRRAWWAAKKVAKNGN